MTQNPYTFNSPFIPPEPSPGPQRRRPSLPLLVLGAALVLGLIAVLFLLLTGSDDRPLKVRLQLLDFEGGSDCSGGDGGYDDIAPGMPITVKDQDGKLIGSESLPSDGESQDVDGVTYGCIWDTVIRVPDDAEQYVVEGGSRGAVTYSRDKLEDSDWVAELSIGD